MGAVCESRPPQPRRVVYSVFSAAAAVCVAAGVSLIFRVSRRS